MPQVANLRTGAAGEVSEDRRAQLIEFDMKGKADTADKRVQPLLDAVAGLEKASPGFTVAEFGMASSMHELNNTISKDFQNAEKLSVPVTFIILLLAFGAFVAAGVPVLLAFSAVLGSVGLSALASHVFHASDATQSVILLMGMAVGVDYSLFYLKREREERAAGHAGHEGLFRAAATSGQAVLISGFTVLIAMAGLLFAGTKIFTSIGIGAMLVVLTLPVLNIHTKLLSFTDLPKSLSIVKTYDTIQASFPGSQDPAHLVVKADDVTTPQFAKAYAEFKKRALATGVIHQPIRVSVNKAKTVARVDFPLAGKGQDAAAVRALSTLRTQVIPPVLATLPPGTQQAVTGDTAANVDFNKTMKTRAPIVFAFVLGFAFLLLLLTFRSIVIPIKAILLNLLSVGAAYGVLVWIFQDGHLQGLLGFHSNGAVVTWLPLFLFTVLFGLSMDYHVFILSRVKELVDQGVPTDQAVERGIRTTASTVTSAAAVMIAVFAIFASLRTLDIKQLGVGLAVAVLLDATLIRGVLLPAAMKLLGEWNWYLPRWLEWLPSLSPEGAPAEKAPEAPAVPASN